MDNLKEAVERRFDLNLWPPNFIYGCALLAASNRLNIDAIILALLTATTMFIGKSEIKWGGSDKIESGSLWVVNVQVHRVKAFPYE